MAYRIVYHPGTPDPCPGQTKKHRFLPLLCVLLLLWMLFPPMTREEKAQTRTAFHTWVCEIRQPDAFRRFCLDILNHGD